KDVCFARTGPRDDNVENAARVCPHCGAHTGGPVSPTALTKTKSRSLGPVLLACKDVCFARTGPRDDNVENAARVCPHCGAHTGEPVSATALTNTNCRSLGPVLLACKDVCFARTGPRDDNVENAARVCPHCGAHTGGPVSPTALTKTKSRSLGPVLLACKDVCFARTGPRDDNVENAARVCPHCGAHTGGPVSPTALTKTKSRSLGPVLLACKDVCFARTGPRDDNVENAARVCPHCGAHTGGPVSPTALTKTKSRSLGPVLLACKDVCFARTGPRDDNVENAARVCPHCGAHTGEPVSPTALTKTNFRSLGPVLLACKDVSFARTGPRDDNVENAARVCPHCGAHTGGPVSPTALTTTHCRSLGPVLLACKDVCFARTGPRDDNVENAARVCPHCRAHTGGPVSPTALTKTKSRSLGPVLLACKDVCFARTGPRDDRPPYAEKGARFCCGAESKAVVLCYRGPTRATKARLGARNALAGEHGFARKKSLRAFDRALVVVEKFETALAQFENGDVGRGPHIERAAVVKQRKNARGIERGASDRLVDCHAITEKFRHAVGEIDDAGLMRVDIPVGGKRVRPEARLHDGGDGIPAHVPGHAVAYVEPDAASPGREHRGEDVAAIVDDAIWWGREHVGDDVAALE